MDDVNEDPSRGAEKPRSSGISWLSKLEDGKEQYGKE